jgi:hypothetical protein
MRGGISGLGRGRMWKDQYGREQPVPEGARGVTIGMQNASLKAEELAQTRTLEMAKINAENQRAAAQRAHEMRGLNTRMGNPDGKFVTQAQFDSNRDFWTNGGYSVPQLGKDSSGSGQVSPQAPKTASIAPAHSQVGGTVADLSAPSGIYQQPGTNSFGDKSGTRTDLYAWKPPPANSFGNNSRYG